MNTVANDEARWLAVLQRDAAASDAFVYAVETTGVFCKPTCPSRRPKRENVRFFPSVEAAVLAGFRACKRCRPSSTSDGADTQAALVAAACRYLAQHTGRIPSLRELANHVGLSEGYLHRLFKRYLGLTPRAYADALRDGRLRERLRTDDSVTSALYEAGYGSSSRLYDGGGARLGMTPATYRHGADGVAVRYTIAPCRLGRLLVAATERGVCLVVLGDSEAEVKHKLDGEFPKASIERDDRAVGAPLRRVLSYLEGAGPIDAITLDVQATAFQRRVWDALQRIPYGETTTYAELAHAAGAPGAARAVGRACASNPVALVVPCHRVVRSDGKSGGYRWGEKRKQALLSLERTKAARR